jgi:hypothetical protein
MANPLLDRDPSDPLRRAVELAQRGRMILDVATVDLEAAEQKLGPFHPTSWHFRQALAEARRSWDRLRAEFGGSTIESALNRPPITFLTLGGGGDGELPTVVLIPIAGQTYRSEKIAGTPLAPTQWRLTRLVSPLEHGPYYACRLRDGSTHCDCAEWAYREDSPNPPSPCKHLAALGNLGWI